MAEQIAHVATRVLQQVNSPCKAAERRRALRFGHFAEEMVADWRRNRFRRW